MPVPVDWRDTFQFDFVDFTGDLHQPGLPDKWVFLKHGADGTNMLTEFAEPLTEEQLEKLRMKVTGTQPIAVPI